MGARLLCIQLEGLENELKCVREAGAGGFYQPLPLPEGMALSSSDVIASLNEHLVVALQVFFLSSVFVMEWLLLHRRIALSVFYFDHCLFSASVCQQH